MQTDEMMVEARRLKKLPPGVLIHCQSWPTGRQASFKGQYDPSEEDRQPSTLRVDKPKWLIGITKLAAFLSLGFACVSDTLASDGYELWGMGWNQDGQLGTGTASDSYAPILIDRDVASVEAGGRHTLYLKTDKTLWGMGANTSGELGDGTLTPRMAPIMIDKDVIGYAAGDAHSLYIKSDGTLMGMGASHYGQLGFGGSRSDQLGESGHVFRSVPTLIDSDVIAASTGGYQSAYLKSDGTLFGLGWNYERPQPDGTIIAWEPRTVIDTDVMTVFSNWHHTLYLRTDGTLMAMGQGHGYWCDSHGNCTQYIDWTAVDPTAISLLDTGVVFAAAGYSHTLYIKSNGDLIGLGSNLSGQLAGKEATYLEGGGVVIDSDVVMAAGGAEHSHYVTIDGTLLGMGLNNYGQLGDGTTETRRYSVEIATDVVAVSDGAYHSLFLKRIPSLRIVQPPQSLTVAHASSATLTVETGRFSKESYVWRHAGKVVGDNSPILTLDNVQLKDAGAYSVTVTLDGASVTSRAVTLGVKEPPYYTEKLLNISTRGQILTGSKIMIAGFVLEGSGQKEVLIRGIGPTLGDFGVPGACTDPRLELFRVTNPETSYFAHNEVWGSLPGDIPALMQRVGGFALADGSKDAVLSMELEPGAYTAQVSGLDGTGVGLVELYDADLDPTASTCNLANISTRGEVGIGSQFLIAGFVISGEVPKQVLVRGIGPRLADFGVGGTLADPYLHILKNVGSDQLWVASNDNWSENPNAAEIVGTSTAVGAFGLTDGSKDAVMLTWLEPGVYTAQVSGVDEMTGVALVEVYEVR